MVKIGIGHIAVFFALVLFSGLILSTIEGPWTPAFFLSCVIIVYSALKLTDLAFRRTACFFQMTYWLFVYSWLGLAAAAQTKSMSFSWPGNRQTPDNLLATNVAILLSMAAYEFGVFQKNKFQPSMHSRLRFLRVPGFARFVVLTILCIGVSGFAIASQGGLETAFLARHDTERRYSSGQNTKSELLLASALQHHPPFIALLVSLYLLLYDRYGAKRRRTLVLIVFILVCYNWIANYPPSLARVSLGSDILSIAFLFIGARWRLKPAFMLAMVTALTVLFPYLDYFRTVDGYSSGDIQSPVEALVHKADYDAFQMLSNGIAVVGDKGPDYGYHLLGSALFFVPRAVWSDKPNGTGTTIGEQLGYRMLNLSAPLWVEFYFAGGVVALLLGFSLFGRVTSRLENSIGGGPDPITVLLSYGAGYQIFLLRGDLMNAIAYSSLSILLILFYLVDIRQVRGKGRRARTAATDYAIVIPAGRSRGQNVPALQNTL